MGNKNCLFCEVPDTEVIIANSLCFARWDKYPVSPGHLLVIPRRHFESVFEATIEENQAIWELINKGKELIDKQQKPDGFNVGTNVGQAAGQSIFHAHIHIIPRYAGDVDKPLGGVRGVLPHRQQY